MNAHTADAKSEKVIESRLKEDNQQPEYSGCRKSEKTPS